MSLEQSECRDLQRQAIARRVLRRPATMAVATLVSARPNIAVRFPFAAAHNRGHRTLQRARRD